MRADVGRVAHLFLLLFQLPCQESKEKARVEGRSGKRREGRQQGKQEQQGTDRVRE
jgi:hypothetical protein